MTLLPKAYHIRAFPVENHRWIKNHLQKMGYPSAFDS